MIVDVLRSYGDVRYLRKCESRGGFRSLAEDNGQAGDLTCGAGTMALVCLGEVVPAVDMLPSYQGLANAPVSVSTPRAALRPAELLGSRRF